MFGMAIWRNNFKWTVPAIIILGGSKYYSAIQYREQISKEGIESYWLRSKKFIGDLNKVERYVNQLNENKKKAANLGM